MSDEKAPSDGTPGPQTPVSQTPPGFGGSWPFGSPAAPSSSAPPPIRPPNVPDNGNELIGGSESRLVEAITELAKATAAATAAASAAKDDSPARDDNTPDRSRFRDPDAETEKSLQLPAISIAREAAAQLERRVKISRTNTLSEVYTALTKVKAGKGKDSIHKMEVAGPTNCGALSSRQLQVSV